MDIKTYVIRKRELDRVHCVLGEDGNVSIRPEFAWEGCPFCGPGISAKPYRLSALAKGLTLVRCTACGLVYPRPRLNRQSTDERVTAAVHQEYYRESLAGQFIPSCYSHSEIRFIMRHWSVGEPGRTRVLDVGCAGGDFLCCWRDHGYEVVGLEANPSMLLFCQASAARAPVK